MRIPTAFSVTLALLMVDGTVEQGSMPVSPPQKLNIKTCQTDAKSQLAIKISMK